MSNSERKSWKKNLIKVFSAERSACLLTRKNIDQEQRKQAQER
ncbi:MAG: hypothetical protein O4861_17340 [Trichodesmium sp. St16_bin4-tuft]|nr:hypothetical protein [Trichodesmium sp. St16_bin4-tuft]